MPVNQALIEQQIGLLIDSTSSLELEASKTAFKSQLSLIIYNAILSATVTLLPGSIITVGGPTSQTNAAPAIGSLT